MDCNLQFAKAFGHCCCDDGCESVESRATTGLARRLEQGCDVEFLWRAWKGEVQFRRAHSNQPTSPQGSTKFPQLAHAFFTTISRAKF